MNPTANTNETTNWLVMGNIRINAPSIIAIIPIIVLFSIVFRPPL
jgi:hypothetical protein